MVLLNLTLRFLDWQTGGYHERMTNSMRPQKSGGNICNGGTAIFSINKTSHLVISKGQEESKFGRWCRTRYRGKHDHTLCIITHTAQIHRVVLSPCMLDIVCISTVLMMTYAPVLCFFRIYAKTYNLLRKKVTILYY